MRPLGLTLASLLFATAALAQPPGNNPVIPAPGTPKDNAPALNPNNRLDALLMQWEARMKGVDAVYIPDMTRTDRDKDGTVKVLKGQARFLKPNYAAIQLVRVDNPNLYEMYISTGTRGYNYRPQTKTLQVYELEAQNARLMNAGILSFVGGMGAAQAKARFNLTVTKDEGPSQPFIYIDALPKADDDKREFVRAQLVFVASTMLPRRLWLVQANGSEVTYDLATVDTRTPLAPKDFVAPNAPADWKVEQIPLKQQPSASPTGAPPRVARPTSAGK
ncbi:MAG: LolA family protein [Gemmataceae bacterium]